MPCTRCSCAARLNATNGIDSDWESVSTVTPSIMNWSDGQLSEPGGADIEDSVPEATIDWEKPLSEREWIRMWTDPEAADENTADLVIVSHDAASTGDEAVPEIDWEKPISEREWNRIWSDPEAVDDNTADSDAEGQESGDTNHVFVSEINWRESFSESEWTGMWASESSSIREAAMNWDKLASECPHLNSKVVPKAEIDWETPLSERAWNKMWSTQDNDDSTAPRNDHYREKHLRPAEVRRRLKYGFCLYCGEKGHTRTACAAGLLMSQVPKTELNRRLREHLCPICGDTDRDGHTKWTCPKRKRWHKWYTKSVHLLAEANKMSTQNPKSKRNKRRRGKKQAEQLARKTVGHRENENKAQNLANVKGHMRESVKVSSSNEAQQTAGNWVDAGNDMVVCGDVLSLPIVRDRQTTGVAGPGQKTVKSSHRRRKHRKSRAKGKTGSAEFSDW